MHMRPLDTTRDFPTLAALFAARDPDPPTPALLHEWEANAPAGLVRQRLIEFADANEKALVGYCDSTHWPWDAPHSFEVATLVAPNYRWRGLGGQLTEAALAFLRGNRGRPAWWQRCATTPSKVCALPSALASG